MEMLEHILEGLPGSPLRKALISSGLGEDTTGCGLETDLRQMYYSTGLKGVDPRKVQDAEMLIFETLADLAEDGIDPAAVEAAVNSVEFSYRENNSGRFPRGLSAMIQALSTWLYDGDPLAPLAWEGPLADIKARLAAGEKVFENAIRDHFLNNEHRATVVEATSRLQAAQSAPDSPEALATIPSLGMDALPLRNTPVPCVREALSGGQTWLAHDLPTSGIAYTALLLPLNAVPARLEPLLPLFARSLTEVGTARRDFSELGARMAAKTGGVGADPLLATTRGERGLVKYLSVAGKAVYDKVPDLFDIFREILLEPLTDRAVRLERLRQMLLEDKARLEHGLVAAGHSAVGSRLRAHFTPSGLLAERLSGISQLMAVREHLQRLDSDPDSLLADLDELRRLIVASPDVLVDCTAETAGLDAVQRQAADLLAALPAGRDAALVLPPFSDGLPAAEAFLAPAQINYVGKAANLYDLGYTYHGSASVILRYMRMGYLWERVRVRGGAYGAFCMLDRMGGTLVCASYRDPNVDETLTAYDQMADYLRSFRPDKEQLTSAIVGAIGDLDSYLLPDARGAQGLARHLAGDDEDARQQMRDEILGTTARHFRDFADVLAEAAGHGVTCVLGGAQTRAAAEAHGWQTQELL